MCCVPRTQRCQGAWSEPTPSEPCGRPRPPHQDLFPTLCKKERPAAGVPVPQGKSPPRRPPVAPKSRASLPGLVGVTFKTLQLAVVPKCIVLAKRCPRRDAQKKHSEPFPTRYDDVRPTHESTPDPDLPGSTPPSEKRAPAALRWLADLVQSYRQLQSFPNFRACGLDPALAFLPRTCSPKVTVRSTVTGRLTSHLNGLFLSLSVLA